MKNFEVVAAVVEAVIAVRNAVEMVVGSCDRAREGEVCGGASNVDVLMDVVVEVGGDVVIVVAVVVERTVG